MSVLMEGQPGVYDSGARLKAIAEPLAASRLPAKPQAAPGSTTAPSNGRVCVKRFAPSAPSTKAAVDIASASAALGAVTLALALPSAGRPVRGSSRWPSLRLLYSKYWNV